MNNELLVNLININVIKPGTEIAVLRYGKSLDGTATATNRLRVFGAEDKDGNQKTINVNANHIVEVYECGITEKGIAFLKAHSTEDGKICAFGSESIKLIDHMLPVKLAGVYGFNADGTKRKQGKKRGRKPKKRVTVTNGQIDKLSRQPSNRTKKRASRKRRTAKANTT